MKGRILLLYAVVLASVLVPVLLMWPVPLRPHRAFFGYPGDAVATLTTFSNSLVGSGGGLRALLPRQRWLVDTVGGLVAAVTNAFVAYNVLVFLSFPLSLATAYLLCRRLGVPPWASVLAGLIFAYCPYHLHRCYAHLYLATTQWVPLFLLAAIAIARRFDALRLAGLVASVSLLFVTSAYYGVFACAFIPLIVVWRVAWRRQARDARRWWRDPLLLGLLLMVLVVLALLWREYGFFVRVAEVGGSEWLDFARTFSAKWWNYLVPPSDHPIVGGLLTRFWAERLEGSNVGEQALYVGYGVLFLATVGVVTSLRGREPDRRWMLLLMVIVLAVLLSGPLHLQVGRARVPTLSWLLWRVVPVLRAHTRMAVFLMAALAPFAALGAARLSKQRSGRVLVVLAVVLTVVEYSPIPPFRCTTLEPPPAVYTRLGPFQQGEKMVEYPAQNLREGSPVASVVSYLRSLPGRPPPHLAPDADPSRYAVVGPRLAGVFGAHGVRWLATMGHNTLYPADRFPKDWARAAEASFGWSPLVMSHSRLRLSTSYDEDRLYEPLPAPPPVSYGAASGFVPAPAPRSPWSWSADGGRVWVHSHGPEPLAGTVVFHLTSYGFERTVMVYAEYGLIAEQSVPAGEEVSLHLSDQVLKPGPNEYYLRCVPPASDPARPLARGETRALGFCVRSVEVRSGSEPLTDVTFERGFYGLETPPEGLLQWWMGTRGTIHVRNWQDDTLAVSIHIKLRSRGHDRTLDLSLNGEDMLRLAISMSYIRTVDVGGVKLQPGLNVLTLDELTDDPPDLKTPRMGVFDFWVMAPGEPAFRVSYEHGFRRGATGEFPEGPKICDGTGAVFVTNGHDATVKVELQLRLRSLGTATQVAASLNGYRIGSTHLSEGGSSEVRFQDLSLVPGDNLLLLAPISRNEDVPLSVEQVSIRRLEGFYPPEATRTGVSRWMAHHAAYVVGNESGAPWRGDLRLVVRSFAMPRVLEIYRGEALMKAVRVPSDAPLPVTLSGVLVAPGENTFRFYSPDGADAVSAYTEASDQRPVSFRFFDVSLEPRRPTP